MGRPSGAQRGQHAHSARLGPACYAPLRLQGGGRGSSDEEVSERSDEEEASDEDDDDETFRPQQSRAAAASSRPRRAAAARNQAARCSPSKAAGLAAPAAAAAMPAPTRASPRQAAAAAAAAQAAAAAAVAPAAAAPAVPPAAPSGWGYQQPHGGAAPAQLPGLRTSGSAPNLAGLAASASPAGQAFPGAFQPQALGAPGGPGFMSGAMASGEPPAGGPASGLPLMAPPLPAGFGGPQPPRVPLPAQPLLVRVGSETHLIPHQQQYADATAGAAGGVQRAQQGGGGSALGKRMSRIQSEPHFPTMLGEGASEEPRPPLAASGGRACAPASFRPLCAAFFFRLPALAANCWLSAALPLAPCADPSEAGDLVPNACSHAALVGAEV